MPNVVGGICNAGAGFHKDHIRIYVEAGIKGSVRAHRHGPGGTRERIWLRQYARGNFSAGIVDGYIYINRLSVEGDT